MGSWIIYISWLWIRHHLLALLCLSNKYVWALTLFGKVICFSSPFSTGLLSCTSQAQSHTHTNTMSLSCTHSPTHTTHTHTPNLLLPSCWVCILFPEVLISFLARCPALPSSLCPLCPEQSREQPTVLLDWRLYLLQINRNRSIYCKLMKILLYYKKRFSFALTLLASISSLIFYSVETCWEEDRGKVSVQLMCIPPGYMHQAVWDKILEIRLKYFCFISKHSSLWLHWDTNCRFSSDCYILQKQTAWPFRN